MRVGGLKAYVFWTKLISEVIDAAPPDAVWVNVNRPDGYFKALRDVWARGEGFVSLEHDVVCRPDVVEAFSACPEQWCRFPYRPCCPDSPRCLEAQGNYLGCTRFRSELIQEVPHAVESVIDRHWSVLCEELGANLREAGFTPHFHQPFVDHLR